MGIPAAIPVSRARTVRRRGLLCAPVILLALLLAFPRAAAADPKAIVNKDHASVPLDRQMLRAIFTMRMRAWPDGTPVRVFVLPDDSTTHDEFCREQLGMYTYVLRDLWNRLEYTGTGFAPTTVQSLDEMRKQVQATPGAIGYAEGDVKVPRADGQKLASAGGSP